MALSGVIEGVYLSSSLDLEELFAGAFAPYAGRVRLRRPDQIDDPAAITFALCWHPAADGFTRYPRLKLAASIAAGVDNLLICPSLPPDVIVTRISDPGQAALMAGFAVWHVIWHQRSMGRYVADAQAGRWQAHEMAEVARPAALPVGVLGFGGMGRAVARAVAALGFPVIAAANSLPAEPEPGVRVEAGPGAIQRTAAAARILINVLPLTAETRDILNRDLFAVMPKGSVLIQIGRGAHLVDGDLDWALDQGIIAAASLDVFRTEPLPAGHPWWRDPRLLLTPHQASETDITLVAEQVTAAAEAIVDGRRPRHAVDRSKGY